MMLRVKALLWGSFHEYEPKNHNDGRPRTHFWAEKENYPICGARISRDRTRRNAGEWLQCAACLASLNKDMNS